MKKILLAFILSLTSFTTSAVNTFNILDNTQITGSTITASTQFLGPNGTACTTPAYSFSNGLTTGLAYNANTMLLCANNTNVGNFSSLGLNLTNLTAQSYLFADTNGLVNFKLATTNTVFGNATNATANPTALAVPSCSTSSQALNWTTNTGFGCNASITATTNANLTGPITSVGNATSVAAQTGTGSTFVMQTSPTITGQLGVGVSSVTTAGLTLTQTALTSTQIQGINLSSTAPSTATLSNVGIQSTLATAAAAFTETYAVHYAAGAITKGAGSTIGNGIGFWAQNALASATTNYGFYSDINTAVNTWAFYGFGTAPSYFGGTVQVATQLGVGGIAIPQAGINITGTLSSSTQEIGAISNITSNVSATSETAAYQAQVTTTAAAYTSTDAVGYDALSFTKGVGSTITNAKGFWARNAIAVGTNNYGYFSDLNIAPNTYSFYSSGTAPAAFPVIIANGSTPTLTGTCTTGSQVGGMTAGKFTATCTAQTVIMTFNVTAPNGYVCNAQDTTTVADKLQQTAYSTTSCTLTGTTAANDVIVFNAVGF